MSMSRSRSISVSTPLRTSVAWLLLTLVFAAAVPALAAGECAPWIDTWLVAGPFENDAANSGFQRDWIGEASVVPAEGDRAGGETWTFLDDRLLSRSYDDYQDLFSYFNRIGAARGRPRVAYAHAYVWAPSDGSAQLRIGAQNCFRAWWNGESVAGSERPLPHRDLSRADIKLRRGWNRLLLKVATPVAGRLGFYARPCAPDGSPIPGLIPSPDGDRSPSLAVSTRPLAAQRAHLLPKVALPTAFREWPYVEADALRDPDPDLAGLLARKPHLAMRSSPFRLTAGGGTPPYRWAVEAGELPPGLSLSADGEIRGTLPADAPLGDCTFTARVTDAAGSTAGRQLTLPVQDRPNRWYEEARLVALIHNPESILGASQGNLDEFARLMRMQGYGLGMMIAYNNGDFRYRFPNRFDPDAPDLAVRYKTALELEGIRFGLYMGNLIGPNHGGEDGALLMVTEAAARYRPAALWCDWASPDPDGYVSLDALYGAIRTVSPETLIVLNGVVTCYQGDWDVVCLEGWGAWGPRAWSLWPFRFRWPKAVPVESWRLVPDPTFEYSKGIEPDWRECLRVQVSLIGEGFVANIDHSPTIARAYKNLYESDVMRAHREMAAWASPAGRPSLVESYTGVVPGPFQGEAWGYSTLNLRRDKVYLHVLQNPLGKTGMPPGGSIEVGPLPSKATAVGWLNGDRPLTFSQSGDRLTIRAAEAVPDPIDTIISISLDAPLPPLPPRQPARPSPVPPGNLATGKPARLLSTDGSRDLVPSAFQFARFGVDGLPSTHAQGAYEWAWTYHVDLEGVHPVRRVAIRFAPSCFATEYRILLSEDNFIWREATRVPGSEGGFTDHSFDPIPARFVRIEAIKPDGDGQRGVQMGISELEVYR